MEGAAVFALAKTLSSVTRGDLLVASCGGADEASGGAGAVKAWKTYGVLSGSWGEAPNQAAQRQVVIATNMAESSLTLPDVEAVVDFGMHRVNEYNDEEGQRGAQGADILGHSCRGCGDMSY